MFRDPPPPAACARIRAALEAHGRGPTLAAELGPLLRTLAASKASGTFLCLGEGAGEAAAWILDGMDLSSGLVALVQEPEEEAALERELARELRASVHRQDAEAFLLDVSSHRFDLIADLTARERPAVARLGLGLLRTGGLYVASHAGNTLDSVFAQRAAHSDARVPRLAADAFSVALLEDTGDLVLITRRPERTRPSRRSR
jgi:predicted O-methyltransferase YrrM